MSNVAIKYTQDEKCILAVDIPDSGERCFAWDGKQDFSLDSTSLGNNLFVEVIYQTVPAPCLVLGVKAGHDLMMDVSGEFKQEGRIVVALADSNADEYNEPCISALVNSGEQVTQTVTV